MAKQKKPKKKKKSRKGKGKGRVPYARVLRNIENELTGAFENLQETIEKMSQ